MEYACCVDLKAFQWSNIWLTLVSLGLASAVILFLSYDFLRYELSQSYARKETWRKGNS